MTQNSDGVEIAKFSQMARSWWDPEGDLKTLHQINPLRLGYILEKINVSNLDIVDVGCGGGILSEALAAAGAKVTGIDMGRDVIEVAKLHQFESKSSVKYLQIDADLFAETHAGQFDVVTCLELLEHVPDPAAMIAACSKLLKPTGHLFFSTLNRNLKSYIFAILGAEYFLKLLPKNTHDYAKFIRPSELGEFLRKADMTLQELKGIHYNPFTSKFKLTHDIAVNYLGYATKNLK
ncbi:MAG: bifunctional 2-polyprenyl-6-hydroxyphenol methylase/3-demethylubiquinol 3-O-methyltransferase UbiG [Gammaproteobacteria bacterium]|nr:bifunctional 2-polyprenyl-6-hydroxyphenol methylase/3-demethylubiquinol 3-O-methyltransferase UbiG [Gammaproteobacteria bacterium]